MTQRRALLALPALWPALQPALSPAPAAAQPAWPQRPVRLVVPYAAGGGTDILARALAEALRPALPQPVVVENRAGAAGVIGSEMVMRAEPDGQTLLMVVSTHVMNRHVMAQLPFDPIRDFTPVAMLTRNTMVLAASAALPFTDLRGMAAYARANPARLSTGSTEALSSFLGQELARRLGIETPDVQYRSGGQLMTDIVAGHLPMGWTSTASVTPHMGTGRVRVIAVSTATRTPFFPDVPSAQEQGVAEFDLAGWVGLFAPPRMAEPLAARIREAFMGAFRDEALRQRLATLGIEPDLRDGAGLLAAMQREDRLWAAAAAAGHIQRQQ
ncbi:Bug family tripartite tricarboxylate transporter substrate binding protein [Rubritepida flocculans]|uniref:Bug family tripartite tricarboxylate transporter substrate binding protein n=1 Tax=Rubritepida flocculans TaxID=182403 RepID=UPI00040D6E68|nr:tripartite tricarboxylate transporter substrate binding protein [Rubritepida flocculans]